MSMWDVSANADLDLRQFGPSLRRDDSGIWVSGGSAPVSYPARGNATCFQVEDGSFWFAHRNALLIAVMRRWPPAMGMIFDVGGGNGFVARAMQDAGWTVVLVEPGPDGAANARRARGVTNVVCAGLRDAVFKPASLPSVGLFDVVEHIEDDERFLCDVRDLLSTDGRLFVTVPAYQWLWSTEDEGAGHFRRYTARTLGRALRAAGFEMEYISYFFSMLPVPIFLLRSLPSKVGWRRAVTVERTRDEHGGGGSRSALMRLLLERERRKVAAARTIHFGSSIIAVARRKT